jgi:hypothetical protein
VDYTSTRRLAGAALGQKLALACDPVQDRVASRDRIGERPRAERPADAPLAVVEVHRVVHPPGAVVVPQMMALIRAIDAKRRKSDRHLAPLSI